MVTGWQYVSGKWYYLAESGAMCIGWEFIGGKWYHFSESGAMCIGWEFIGGKWYHFSESGVMCIGWEFIGGKWYHFSESGAMCIGWESIAGEWYYFDENGVMITGKYTMWDKETEKFKDYYFASDGRWKYTVSLITWDLVDSGKHLDWSGKTKYSSYVATATKKWNNS